MNARHLAIAICLPSVIGCMSAAMAANPNGVKAAIFPPVAVGPQPVVPTQFDITGHIQMASLDTAGTICKPADPKLAGGLVTVNGTTITIPCNTILQMPAAALTWAELFDPNLQPASLPFHDSGFYGYNTITGLALTDMEGPATIGVPANTPPMLTNLVPTGGSMASVPYPMQPAYQIHVQGNIMQDGEYIAGLVFIAQDAANIGQGFIKSIDYTKGELCIATSKPAAGFPVQSTPNPACQAPDARVRPNDPLIPSIGTGRYGLGHGKPGSSAQVIEANYDPRFTADQDNPTIRAMSGYPMCIPRTFPFGISGQNDPLCPQENRPIQAANGGGSIPVTDPDTGTVIGSTGVGCQNLPPANGRPAVNGINFPNFPSQSVGAYCHSYVMDETPNLGVCGTVTVNGVSTNVPCTTRPDQQAPFEVGDYVSYSGVLTVDNTSTNPYYVSAHTAVANLGIYTYPGTKPVYAAIDDLLAGTNGLALPNIPQETTSKIRVIAHVSDPGSIVDIFAMDVDQLSGVTTDRLLANFNPSGPPSIGRVKFQPLAGAYPPPTRNMRIVSRALCNSNYLPCYYPQEGGLDPITGAPFGPAAQAANGLKYGQYNAPNFQFVFPENLAMGDQVVPNNLQDLPFLYCGSGPLSTPSAIAANSFPVVGPLSPPPWAPPMPQPVNPYNVNQALCSSALATGTATAGTTDVTAGQPIDAVTILNATWDNRRGKGKINIIAVSNLDPKTNPNLQLYVQAWDANGVPMAANPVAMGLINNQMVNNVPVCVTSVAQCWQFIASGVIIDPAAAYDPLIPNNTFAPIYTVTVSSSRGGQMTISKDGVSTIPRRALPPPAPAIIRLRCSTTFPC